MGFCLKKLATIICDVPLNFHQEQYDLETPDFEKSSEVLMKLNSEDCKKICIEHLMSNQQSAISNRLLLRAKRINC